MLSCEKLILKALYKVAADGTLLFLLLFVKKIRFDVSCESSAEDSHQISSLIFSEKNEKVLMKVICYSLTIGALRVNHWLTSHCMHEKFS